MRESSGRTAFVLAVAMLAAGTSEAQERRADVAVQLAFVDYSQFDDGEFGIGAEVSYRITGWLAADAQLTYSPSDLGDPASFSGSRFEGLFGVRLGHRFGSVGVHGAVRPGFVSFAEAPEPLACIAIFPPPLACSLAEGKSVFALNLGAGLELTPGDRLVVRAEVGDLLLKYPGPAFDKDMEVFTDHLWSHNLRVTASVGIRF